MKIIPYHPSNYKVVLQLQKEALIHIDAWKGDGPWDDDLKTIEQIYDGIKGEFCLGILKNEVVAMGAYYFTSETDVEIRRMRISPHLQGNGLAKKMYQHLENRAIQKGAKRFYLDTGEVQSTAIRFYKKMGFTEFGRATYWDMPCILFEKLIR